MQSRLLNLPPLDALRGFVAAARRMSITAAAEELCLTQSAVSRQVQALEARLGVALFIRNKRSIALTEAGEQLFRLVSPWMDRLSDLADALREPSRLQPVTVTASIGTAALWLLPRLGAFQAAHPAIDVRIAASNHLVDLEREGIDLAIRYSASAQVPGDALRLFDEEVVPVASKAVAATAFGKKDGLSRHILLDLDDRGRPWLHWATWLRKQPRAIQPKGYLHFNQYDQVVQAAIEGHGVALGRLALVVPMLRDGRLVASMEQRMRVDSYAYWLVQAAGPVRTEVALFRDWLVEQVALTSQQMAQLRQ
jgi:LysR family glycine cleavage system transcriptional activator